MFQTEIVKKTHILCSITFFFLENRAVYEIMRKNIVERGRSQMTIWRMRIVYWIPMATNTHSEYVIIIAFPRRICLRERALLLRYMYVLDHVSSFTLYFCSITSQCGICGGYSATETGASWIICEYHFTRISVSITSPRYL